MKIFNELAMGPSYTSGYTIERKNVNGPYNKDNCIWITKKLQSRNRRSTIWIETEKGTLTITEAAKLANVSWYCMYNRFIRNCPKEKLLFPAYKVGRNLKDVSNTT